MTSFLTTFLAGAVIGGLGSPTVSEMFEDYATHEVEAAFKVRRIVLPEIHESNIEMIQAAFALQIMWAMASGLYKTSILLFYRDIFPNLRRISAIAICGVIFLAFGTILGIFLACEHVEDNWKHITPFETRCGNRSLAFQTSGAINIATDVVVLLIPIRDILKLQVPRYRRIILITTFTLGWL